MLYIDPYEKNLLDCYSLIIPLLCSFGVGDPSTCSFVVTENRTSDPWVGR